VAVCLLLSAHRAVIFAIAQLSCYFRGFLRLCQFWWKSIKKCDRESAHRRTDRRTDANRFYNLSRAIRYSYGARKLYYPKDYRVMHRQKYTNNKQPHIHLRSR